VSALMFMPVNRKRAHTQVRPYIGSNSKTPVTHFRHCLFWVTPKITPTSMSMWRSRTKALTTRTLIWVTCSELRMVAAMMAPCSVEGVGVRSFNFYCGYGLYDQVVGPVRPP
jgi:hypothetical protein